MATMDPSLLLSLQRMDIFSLGCLIYQIFQDGKYLFDYEGLQRYSKAQVPLPS